ncbi:MAG: amidohydrolase [Clostridia bacterium]|nr:amidohydrolase [Clostridia bacterium]
MDKLFEYCVSIRRQLHEYPETGFELERTASLVKRELTSMGIEYSCGFGKSSIVAQIGQGEKIIAFRADMDALPVEEKTDLPFRSKISGKMHACGHDAHTAILLAVAKHLKEKEGSLRHRIRFIFQPSEECAVSGAEMMVENGVMDGVDHIICTHCENALESGKIGICSGDYMAACVPLCVNFFGKSAHATLPQEGIDAIAMAHIAYGEMEKAVKELAKGARYIWSVGKFSGGSAHNVIAEHCEMDISFRFYDMDFAKHVKASVFEICESVAERFGGRVEIDWNMSTGPVHNDSALYENFKNIVNDCGLQTEHIEQRMSSEDFGWYLTKAKGMIFRFGTRNEKTGCTTLAHCSDFKIDESGMSSAIKAFIFYALNCEV